MTRIEHKSRFASLSNDLVFLCLVAFLFILQVMLTYAGLVRYIDILVTIFIMGIFALSFDLLLGYVGLLNFGHTLFFGMGAYVTAYMLIWTPTPYPAVLIVVTLVGAVLGFLVSYAVRRVFYGVPFTFISLAIAMIVYFLYRKREFIPISGGEQGLVVPIPEMMKSFWLSAFSFVAYSIIILMLLVAVYNKVMRKSSQTSRKFGVLLVSIALAVVSFFVMWKNLIGLLSVPDYKRITPNFYFFSLIVLCICYLLAKKFASSPVGHVWAAIRENEVRAEIIGFDVFKYKLLALMVSGGMAALAGGIYAPYRFMVSPDSVFTPMLVINVIIYAVLGGLGTLSGALLGTAIVIFLDRFLIDYIGGWGPVVIGIIFILFVLSLPGGIIGTWRVKQPSIRAALQKVLRHHASADSNNL